MTAPKPLPDARCPECAWTPEAGARSDDPITRAADALQAHLVSAHGLSAADARTRVERWALFAVDEVTQVEENDRTDPGQ